MMIVPRRSSFDLFDDMFRDPFFNEEKHPLMKTDIKEKDGAYLIDMDLPGYDKENIKIDIENGYLNVHAKMDTEKNEEDEGKFVRRERYIGECSRSFYIGEGVEEDDIKASFKNGILKLEIPKKEEDKEIPEKKYIQIED